MRVGGRVGLEVVAEVDTEFEVVVAMYAQLVSFLLGLHSFKGFLFLRTLVGPMIRVSSVKVTEELLWVARRSASSHPTTATTPSTSSGRTLWVV